MASWRLTANSSGAPAKAAGALLPVPAHDAGGWQSRGPISGSPGTTAISAPAPVPITDRSLAAMANAGNIGLPSSDFSVWYPSVYYQRATERAPVSVQSDNQMPVPAIDPRGKPGVVMPGPVMLGQYQVANPHVAPKFADWKAAGRKVRRG